jgi:hypothetical protein
MSVGLALVRRCQGCRRVRSPRNYETSVKSAPHADCPSRAFKARASFRDLGREGYGLPSRQSLFRTFGRAPTGRPTIRRASTGLNQACTRYIRTLLNSLSFSSLSTDPFLTRTISQTSQIKHNVRIILKCVVPHSPMLRQPHGVQAGRAQGGSLRNHR